MREIEFRGQDVRGNWHYGLLTHDRNSGLPNKDYEYFISNGYGKPYAYGVIKNTIGQYTGVFDANGRKIYEGDVGVSRKGNRYEVVFKDGAFMLLGGLPKEYIDIKWAPVFMGFKVTGNIHEEK